MFISTFLLFQWRISSNKIIFLPKQAQEIITWHYFSLTSLLPAWQKVWLVWNVKWHKLSYTYFHSSSVQSSREDLGQAYSFCLILVHIITYSSNNHINNKNQLFRPGQFNKTTVLIDVNLAYPNMQAVTIINVKRARSNSLL